MRHTKGTIDARVFTDAILFHENKILILKRHSATKIRPGAWDLPGGCINYGEGVVPALKREVWEETGIKIGGKPMHPIHVESFKGNGLFHVAIIFGCDSSTEKVKTSHEHTAHKWLSPQKAAKQDFGKGGAFIPRAIKAFINDRKARKKGL